MLNPGTFAKSVILNARATSATLIARVAAQALDEGVQRDGIDQRELGKRLTLGARQQDRRREEGVEVVRRDDRHVRTRGRAQLRQNVREVVADIDKALFRTAEGDAAVALDAAEHVVAADRDRDEEHAMRVQEVDGLRELVAQWVRALPALDHRGRRFTRTCELLELQQRMAETVERVDAIDVALVRRYGRAVRQRLGPGAQRITKGEVVRKTRRAVGASADREAQH